MRPGGELVGCPQHVADHEQCQDHGERTETSRSAGVSACRAGHRHPLAWPAGLGAKWSCNRVNLAAAEPDSRTMAAGQVSPGGTRERSSWSEARSCSQRPAFAGPCQQLSAGGERDPNWCTAPAGGGCCCTLLLYSLWTLGSGFRIMSLTCGAKEIRTPDLLHAMGNVGVQLSPDAKQGWPRLAKAHWANHRAAIRARSNDLGTTGQTRPSRSAASASPTAPTRFSPQILQRPIARGAGSSPP
jgi:hypothetical protein